jgi:hypothetical protein
LHSYVFVDGGERKIRFKDAKYPPVRGMDMTGSLRAGRFVVDRINEGQHRISLSSPVGRPLTGASQIAGRSIVIDMTALTFVGGPVDLPPDFQMR